VEQLGQTHENASAENLRRKAKKMLRLKSLNSTQEPRGRIFWRTQKPGTLWVLATTADVSSAGLARGCYQGASRYDPENAELHRNLRVCLIVGGATTHARYSDEFRLAMELSRSLGPGPPRSTGGGVAGQRHPRPQFLATVQRNATTQIHVILSEQARARCGIAFPASCVATALKAARRRPSYERVQATKQLSWPAVRDRRRDRTWVSSMCSPAQAAAIHRRREMSIACTAWLPKPVTKVRSSKSRWTLSPATGRCLSVASYSPGGIAHKRAAGLLPIAVPQLTGTSCCP